MNPYRNFFLLALLLAFPLRAAEPPPPPFDPEPIVGLLELLLTQQESDPDTARKCLDVLTDKIESREVGPAAVAQLKPRLLPSLNEILQGKPDAPLYFAAARLAAGLGDVGGVAAIRKVLANAQAAPADRLAAVNALIGGSDPAVLEYAAALFAGKTAADDDHRAAALAALGRSEEPRVAEIVLRNYQKLSADLQPKAIELLTQRAIWAKPLLAAIAAKQIPAGSLNANQVTRLLSGKDEELVKLVKQQWGSIRTERNPEREQVIARMRDLIRKSPAGDPFAGEKVFNRVCGQCHKLHGEGQEVGPDITLNGRNSFEQLLSNVFDPSLTIGAAYLPRIIETSDGRTITGLLAEDNPQRVVLKIQGGKVETIARDDIEAMVESKLSLMPEELEKQLPPQELLDLFAYLTLDKHPRDKAAIRLPGVYAPAFRQTEDSAQFAELVGYILPGFATNACGEGGVEVLNEFRGRSEVLRTHPIERGKPCVLVGEFSVPEGQQTRLLLAVSHDPRGDWQLVVRANGETLLDKPVTAQNAMADGWYEATIDLSKFAGQRVKLELENRPTDWSWEFGYWGAARLESNAAK